MTAPTPPEHDYGTLPTGHHINGQFKRHKVLPRPKSHRSVKDDRVLPSVSDLDIDTALLTGVYGSQSSSPRTLKHQPRRIGTGPDLPPTPPNYSRASSGSHPAQRSSPSPPNASVQTPQSSSKRPPATPPDQRSPPTPDVTPPQPSYRPRALRPLVLDRGCSRTLTATTDSRTESFKTAREEPSSSEDEAPTPTTRTVRASSTPSQTAVLQAPVGAAGRAVEPQALDSALGRLETKLNEVYTRGELAQFDGEWGTPQRAERQWEEGLQKAVSAGSHKPKSLALRTSHSTSVKGDVLEDRPVTPTNATKTVRDMLLKEAAPVKPSPKSSPQTTPQRRRTGLAASRPEVSKTLGPRRSSGVSAHSTPSTVIEAILVDNSSPPQRNRTLRHVRKRWELRESSPRGRQTTVEEAELPLAKSPLRSSLRNEQSRRHDSYTSTTSTNSVASGKARRDVWKTGGIPVVVIPDRRSSQKSRSREPSLRSSSSRRSKRTRSVGSSPLDRSPLSSDDLSFDQPSRWDRSTSVSDGSDQRTVDFPPIIPARSSSLSTPTSRTTSRTGSLTAESLKALNNLHLQNGKPIALKPAPAATTTATRLMRVESAAQTATQTKPMPPAAQVPLSPIISVQSPQTSRSERENGHDFLSAEYHDDSASARKYSSRTTPFSVISMETNWTAPEVSEAQVVHMYPHQNSSVLRIDHCAKPQDTPGADEKGLFQVESNEPPKITATSPEGGVVTPEQRKSQEEVDSPLRNPRSPPDPPAHPPAINFIPATPSGLTPAEERMVQLGNFYEIIAEKPSRRPSLVRRALSGRRHSISYPPSAAKQPGFLTRTFSLSRNDRKSVDADKAASFNPDMERAYGDKRGKPAEQDRLHPHWRPQWDNDNENGNDDCDCSSCRHGIETEEEIYRYPLVDNRPRPLKRSLSAKVKNTFAILPARQEYYMEDVYGLERRTIRRTPSGNLRVMRRRSSERSLRQHRVRLHEERRPVSEGNSQKGFWRGHSMRRRRSADRLRRSSSLSGRFERIPSLTRKWSEKRREKRTKELRQKISGPRDVRDGVSDVIRMSANKNEQVGYSY